MKQVLITISRGIIEEAIFFEDPRPPFGHCPTM